MAEKGKFFDIWIVDIQKVYREVPYIVVIDWVQQGRLLEDDRLRPSGTANWLRVGDASEVQPFLPRPEPHRAEDQAEALEPIQIEFAYKKAKPDEDEDVDMIPLIDVSLVLLVFFMMNAAGGAAALAIPVPETEYATTVNPEGIMLGIDLVNVDGRKEPVYSMSEGGQAPGVDDRDLHSLGELLKRFDDKLKATEGRFPVTINAHKDVPSGVVSDLMAELEQGERRRRIIQKYIGVLEKLQ